MHDSKTMDSIQWPRVNSEIEVQTLLYRHAYF